MICNLYSLIWMEIGNFQVWSLFFVFNFLSFPKNAIENFCIWKKFKSITFEIQYIQYGDDIMLEKIKKNFIRIPFSVFFAFFSWFQHLFFYFVVKSTFGKESFGIFKISLKKRMFVNFDCKFFHFQCSFLKWAKRRGWLCKIDSIDFNSHLWL